VKKGDTIFLPFTLPVTGFLAKLVYLSVFLHDISKIDAAGITKLDTEMFHHESCLEAHLS